MLIFQRAKASLERAQILNPLVILETEDQPITVDVPEDYFSMFDVVISCNQQHALNVIYDNHCRKCDIKFILCTVLGTFGYVFIDFQDHNYTE